MKKETAFLSATLLGALVAIACQSGSDSTTSPSATTAGQDGVAGARVYATPSSSPVGPGGGTNPGPGGGTNPGPGGGTNPGPGGGTSPGPNPAPGPSVYPGFPGSATPTPTPGVTPTPGSTPTPGTTPTPGPALPCPPTFDYTMPGPVNMNNLEMLVPTGNFVDACFVDRMIVTLHARTVDSSNFLGPGATASASWLVCGSGADSDGEYSGCGQGGIFAMTHLSPPSGNQIGTGCGTLIFDDTAPTAFNPPGNPGAPFVGTFKPNFVLTPKGWRLNAEFKFRSFASIGDLELQCLTVTFVTRTTPPPA